MSLVVAEALSRSFAGRGWFDRTRVHAVREVGLGIARGEALGLVGESGSGKSTVGRLLLGLLPPTSGTVRFDGQDLAALPGRALRRLRGRMQIVFQDPYGSLDPRRSVGAQIADGLAIHGVGAASARAATVAGLLARVGLDPDHADRFPHQFSGGQRQRVGIARALATGPDFLVADEPCSALDVSVQAQIVALLRSLRRESGLAMLFISHDLPLVRHLCDRVAVMYLGRVVEEGPVASVFAAPAHPYTRALIAATPSVDPARRRTRILLRGEPPSPAAPPSGCAFRTRCAHALPSCSEIVPPSRRVAAGHVAACLRDDI